MNAELFAVWNGSTVVKDEELQPVVDAIQIQVSEHLGPHYNLDAVVKAYASIQTPPKGSWIIELRDYSGLKGALAYHTCDGTPSGVVGIKQYIDDNMAWSIGISHEVCEAVVDPPATLASEAAGLMWSWEVCDPVENSTYKINGIDVSNFVLPSWFEEGSEAPWDYLGILPGPFRLASGGYCNSAPIGNWEQTVAERTRAQKAAIAPGSRRHMRASRARR